MDFYSCIPECCKNCNSTSKYKSPKSGQGDFKCGGEVQEQNFWANAGKGKKLRSKTVREKEKTDLKRFEPKKLMDVGCNCFAKTNSKQECEHKLKYETKQEKNEPRIFENCNTTWSSYVSDSWKSRLGRLRPSEEHKCTDHSTSEKFLTENVLELEEKVNFLLRIFKDCGCKLPNEGYMENLATKPAGTFGDAWHLFNLNKRLCAAEEGIEKLSLILEELVKESGKKKSFVVADENGNCSEVSGFDKMTMGERINFLKNRNDMLLNLIKTFLKSNSVEEICSRLSSQPIEYESIPSSPNFGGKNHSMDFSREELMEALKNLQVISEQAELVLNQVEDDGDVMGDSLRRNGVRNLKGKYSQVSDSAAGSELGLYDVTSRLLAQEAMLKSSLDKVHLELFSKLDSPDKNFLKTNLNILNGVQVTEKEKNSNSDFESVFGSSSDISCIFCEDENLEELPSNNITHVTSKYTSVMCKEPIKEDRNSFGSSPNGPSKDSSVKKTEERTTGKNKFSSKSLHKDGCTALESPQRTGRNGYCHTELYPSSRSGTKHAAQAQEQRPLTAPTSHRKAIPPCSLKASVPEKSARKNSGINTNVRNKNKILLSKKSFVQTS